MPRLKLNKSIMIEILEKNFGFKTNNDPDFGKTVIMDARDAFRYSLIEGSPFLVNEYGFTCKGRMNVFYHRSSLNKNYYIYCPGLFGVKRENNIISLDEGHSPYYIHKKYSKIFRGNKTIIFYEHNSKSTKSRVEIERDVFNKIKSRGNDPSDYLLTIVTDTESYKENFLEYVTCQYFNKKNYLTECQVPFQNNKGIPDFAAYSFELINELTQNNFISGGCCLPEISTACIFSNSSSTVESSSYKIMLGEAKSGPTNAKSQITKHIATKLADYLFEIIPFKQSREKKCGLFTFDSSSYMINFDEGPKQSVNPTIHKDDSKFLENYVKFYVLANLPIAKIITKYVDKNIPESESSQLIRNVLKDDFSEIIRFVKGEM